jgi:hypothetical protein
VAVNSLAILGGTLFAGTQGRGIYRLNGSEWAPSGLPDAFVNELWAVDGAFLAATALSEYLYVSTNGGHDWEAFADAYTGGEVYDLSAGGGFLHAGSRGRGIWIRPASELTDPTAVPSTDGAVPDIVLRPVRPNPVVDRTAIEYILTAPAVVRIALYDAAGRRIRSLEHGPRDPGEHRLTIDAARLSAGTYFVGLQARGRLQTQRVTIIH